MLMQSDYRVQSATTDGLYIKVCSNYFTVNEAKNAFFNEEAENKKDDTILIQVVQEREGEERQSASIAFGVEEAERFALAILNICSVIKY
ncbi:hypothetical protein [Metabacillus sp. FJAT-52054]|uniref:Uncharacterized protein n=1 Tax=Metabacillus sediminis TaxID=3117746 RepID=A0ABZ2NHI7_9BACI